MLIIIMILCFVCSSVVQNLMTAVKLGDYRYPYNLKQLAKRRLEDSEHLPPWARQNLASVK